jgi:small-conductance mechanosensitive channel
MRLLLAAIALLLAAATARAEDDAWAGLWETHWPGGTAHLELTQSGSKVAGRYPLLGGQIEGTVRGRTLTGTWTEGGQSGSLTFRLAPDRQSFLGRFNDGEWWSGGRIARLPVGTRIDQSTPRAVLNTFVLAGNRWRAGAPDEIGRAASVLDLGAAGRDAVPLQRLEQAQALFNLVDLTTLHLWTIVEHTAQADVTLNLRQSGTEAVLPLHLHHDDAGKWWIVMPDATALEASRTALLARYGGRMPAREAFLQLHNARDTMRSFLDAFAHWDTGGRAQALATLNLSELPEVTRGEEGELAALYLKHVLDRVGLVVQQEIPDDPTNRDPYVHFTHPDGRIAIAPVGDATNAPWKFTPETVDEARDLYAAVGSMPLAGTGMLRTPSTPFFAARHLMVLYAPWSLHRVGSVEQWQAAGAVVLLLAAFVLACLLAWLLLLLWAATLEERGQAMRPPITWPLRIALAFLVWKLAMPVLGLPHAVRWFTDPASAALLALGMAWTGWYLVEALGHRLSSRGTTGGFDEVSLSLAVGALRIAVVAGAFAYIADALGVPYTGIIAGLGISGLAVAFASKETLSNVFGAGVLMIDRPFRRGDTIIAGDTRGTVEHVGIRSTRIRTAEDSVIVMPNGKLSDATINNMGTRRHRLVKMTLVVPYSVGADQIDEFKAALEALLGGNATVVGQRIQVGAKTLMADGVELEATFYLDVTTADAESDARHALVMEILRLAERRSVALSVQHVPAAAEVA